MRKQGFTLIELMIVVMVLGVIFMAMYYLSMSMARTALYQESVTTLRDEGRQAMDRMSRHLRMATRASIETNDGSGQFSGLGLTPVTNIRFVEMRDNDWDGDVVDDDYNIEQSELIYYTQDFEDINDDGIGAAQLVQLDETGDVDRVLASNVDYLGVNGDGLTFQLLQGGGGLLIQLRLTRKGRAGVPAANITTSQVVAVRN
jgi:prepilin-type N-terminal cleavage/methylation domain-containing protein